MRRATLDGIGGFWRFTHLLAEDHAIGGSRARARPESRRAPFTVTHACVEKSATALVSHELRWSRTIRSIDPLGHLGSVLTHPFAFALLGLLLCGTTWWTWAVVCAALLARLSVKVLLDRTLSQQPRGLWLMPAWDLAAFLIFIASFLSQRVTWRGFRFTVRDSKLISSVGEN